MEVNHLRTAELSYELAIRKLDSTGTVDEKRRILRGVLVQELKGIHLTKIIEVPPFEVDVEGANQTITNLEEVVKTFTGNIEEPVYSRLLSRLCHVTHRIERFQVETEEQKHQQSLLYNRVLCLEGDIAEKIQGISGATASFSVSPAPVSPAVPICTPSIKSLPIYKWNIQFSGSERESVNAFLEKIDLLREARRVTKEDLFHSACDLFAGPAWTWYVNNRHKLRNWEELVEKLREDFLPYHYEQDLMREIDQRTQGPHERVTFFISSMENLFNRLKTKPDEQTIVNKIRQNLLPSFIERLALSAPQTVSELTQLCKRLEEADAWSSRYKPPPARKSGLLEPDLSSPFSELSISKSKFPIPKLSKVVPNVSALECWNCHSPGHRYAECQEARRFFCFGCGAANVAKSRCPNCLSKNEQGTGDQTPDTVPSSSRPEPQLKPNTETKSKNPPKTNPPPPKK